MSKSEKSIFFVTGTDTGVGKTLVSCSMLAAARLAGYSTAALKPVAAGVIDTPAGKLNEDVIALAAQCTLPLSPAEINPVCLNEAIAPHVAAARIGIGLSASNIAAQCQPVIDRHADLTLIEGAGGWLVPLGEKESMADIARILNTPVILVVGLRLGCLNHALLTAQSILASGLPLAGWVANSVTPSMPAYVENLQTLKNSMPAPLLAEIPWMDCEAMTDEEAAEFAARHIQPDVLMNGCFH